MIQMITWPSFIETHEGMEQEVFLNQYSYPFLVADKYQPQEVTSMATLSVDVSKGLPQSTELDPSWLIPLESHTEEKIGLFTLGRKITNDIPVIDPSVSGKHARLVCLTQDQWIIEDIDSTNGTFVNENQVAKGGRAPITTGDMITLGDGFHATFFFPDALYEYLQVWRILNQPLEDGNRQPIQTWTFQEFVQMTTNLGTEKFYTTYHMPFFVQQDDFKYPSQPQDETWSSIQGEMQVSLDEEIPRLIHYFPGEFYRIGRVQGDLIIPHPSVSSLHAGFFKLSTDGGTIADLGSTNGTFVNGWRVPSHSSVPLVDKDKIAFGDILFTFMKPESLYNFCTFFAEGMSSAVETPEAALAPAEAAPAPPVAEVPETPEVAPTPPQAAPGPSDQIKMTPWSSFIKVHEDVDQTSFIAHFTFPFLIADRYTPHAGTPLAGGDETEASWLIPLAGLSEKESEQVTFGRKSTNNIPVQHPSVSGQHARLIRLDDSHCVLEDLNSKNGTFVSHNRVEKGENATLKSGDLITLGNGFHATLFFPDALYQYLQVWKILNQPKEGDLHRPIQTWTFHEFVRKTLKLCSDEFHAMFHMPFFVQQDEFPWPSKDPKKTWGKEQGELPTPLDQTTPRSIHYFPGQFYRIGRSQGELILPHPSVSTLHAGYLNMSADGGAAVDLGSKNGTFVNGLRVPAHSSVPLVDKDKVAFGDILFTFMKPESLFNLCTLIAERMNITADSPLPPPEETEQPEPAAIAEAAPELPFDEGTNLTELIADRAAVENKPHPAAQLAKPLPAVIPVPVPIPVPAAQPASPDKSFATGQMSLEKIQKRLKRHPGAKSLGEKGSMDNLMADALQQRVERDEADPKSYTGGVLGAIGPYVFHIIGIVFMAAAWGYILYIFLYQGVY